MKKLIFAFSFLISFFMLSAASVSPAQAKVYREKFVSEAKQHVGAPYVYGAVGPNSFDCSGLIYYCAQKSVSKQLPRTAKALYSYCKTVKNNEVEIGDLLFFRTTVSGSVSHVGIYIGNGQFISAISDGQNTGVIVSSLKQTYWKGKFISAGQFIPSGRIQNNADDWTETPVTAKKKSSSSTNNTARGNPRSSQYNDSEENYDTEDDNFYEENFNSDESSKENSNQIALIKTGSSFYNPDAAFLDSLVFDGSISCGWSFISPHRFLFMWRGIDTTINARVSKWILEPGLGFSLRYNAGTNCFQVPLFLSFTINDNMRVSAGPVFTAGSPKMIDEEKPIQGSIFPGLIEFSFTTPSLSIGKTKFQIMQNVSYTIFNNIDGAALSFVESLSAGVAFHTGIKVTLPISALRSGKTVSSKKSSDTTSIAPSTNTDTGTSTITTEESNE